MANSSKSNSRPKPPMDESVMRNSILNAFYEQNKELYAKDRQLYWFKAFAVEERRMRKWKYFGKDPLEGLLNKKIPILGKIIRK